MRLLVSRRPSTFLSPATWGAILAVLAGIALALLPLWQALLLLLGALFIPLTLAEPLVALAAMLVLAPLGAFENRVWGNRLLDSGQLMLLVTTAAWLARGALRREIRLEMSWLHVPLALFAGIGLLSLLDAPSPSAGFRELLKWVEIALLLAVTVDLMRGSRLLNRFLSSSSLWRLRLLVLLLLLPGISQALGGIWQAVIRDSGPEHFHIAGRFYRPYGTFDQPNPFGGFVAMSACLTIGALAGSAAARWRARSWGEPAEGLWILFLAGTAAVTSAAAVLSWSRGAWLGFAAGLAVMAFFWPRRRRAGMAALAAGVLLLLALWQANLVPTAITARLRSIPTEFSLTDVRGVDINDQNFAVLERLAHWQAALDMARSQPWLGVGLGNYEAAYPDYALLNWPQPLGHAHNIYLNLLAETGAIGIIAYLALWTAVFGQAIRALSRLDPSRRGLMLGALGIWAVLSVHQAVDKLYVNNIYLVLGVLLALQHLLVDSVRASDSERQK